MSIRKKADGLYEIRWREGGRNRSLQITGGLELAKKIERKKMSARDENRHLDVKKEIHYRMTDLIDRYWEISAAIKHRRIAKSRFWKASGLNSVACSSA